jgi:hypothetical protein
MPTEVLKPIAQVEEAWLAAATLEEALDRMRELIEANRVAAAAALAPRLLEKWPEDPAVRHWDRVLQPGRLYPAPITPGRAQMTDGRREAAWYRAHGHEYPNCWIAVHEDRLIAAGPELRPVVQQVRAQFGEQGVHVFRGPATRK